MTLPRLTVAICTWNRAELLRATLCNITRLEIPGSLEWELLVVNNNSNDATETVLEEFSDRLPLRRLWEPRPGVSYARNLAVLEAAGDYILWTDDDVHPDTNWVRAYLNAFQRWPEAALFGGPITPWFEGTPPPWLERVLPAVGSAFAQRDLGDTPLPLDATREVLPFGANFAVRMREQRRFPYHEKLGRKAGGLLGGEEMAVMAHVLKSGCSGWWVPDAPVRHYLPKSRQTRSYLRKYFAGMGEFWTTSGAGFEGPSVCGAPRYLWKEAIVEELRYRVHLLTRPPEKWIHTLVDSSVLWGELHGWRKHSSASRGQSRVG